MYRAPETPARPSGRVVHGPFPVRWGLVGASCAAVFVGVLSVLAGLATERFRCDATLCFVDNHPLFRRSELRGAHVVIETGSKNAKYGVVVVEEEGREHRLMRVDPEQAGDAKERIVEAAVQGTPVDVTLHNPRLMLVFGVAALVAALVLLVIALRTMGRFVLELSHDGSELLVQRRVLGLPVGTQVVSLNGAERVLFAPETIKPVMQGRNEPAIPAGRLFIETRKGDVRRLSARPFPGHATHLRAAAALRVLLLLPSDDRDDAALAALPMRTTPLGMRIAYAWPGLTCGTLLGMVVFGIPVMLLEGRSLRSNIEGWEFAACALLGAILGASVVFYVTRPRPPL